MGSDTWSWRTRFEPLPDITTYELAMDVKYINRSQIVGSWECDAMGSALRHRVLDDPSRRRMDEVYRDWLSRQQRAS
jgi:hypothetical protein